MHRVVRCTDFRSLLGLQEIGNNIEQALLALGCCPCARTSSWRLMLRDDIDAVRIQAILLDRRKRRGGGDGLAEHVHISQRRSVRTGGPRRREVALEAATHGSTHRGWRQWVRSKRIDMRLASAAGPCLCQHRVARLRLRWRLGARTGRWDKLLKVGGPRGGCCCVCRRIVEQIGVLLDALTGRAVILDGYCRARLAARRGGGLRG